MKMNETKGRFSRRTVALFWTLILAIVIGTLLYYEQIALLYVLATLGLTTLLIIVSFADLEKVSRENIEGFSNKS